MASSMTSLSAICMSLAKELRSCNRKKHLQVLGSDKSNSEHFRLLIEKDKKDIEEIKCVLKFLYSYKGEKRLPIITSAKGLRRLYDSWLLPMMKEESPNQETHEEVLPYIENIKSKFYLPLSIEKQIPTFFNKSLNNILLFRSMCEKIHTQDYQVEMLAHDIVDHLLILPLEFLSGYLEDYLTKYLSWEKWCGKLSPWKRDSKNQIKIGERWSREYSRGPILYYDLLESLNEGN